MHLLEPLHSLAPLWRKDWKSQDLGQGNSQNMVAVVYGDPNQKMAMGREEMDSQELLRKDNGQVLNQLWISFMQSHTSQG